MTSTYSSFADMIGAPQSPVVESVPQVVPTPHLPPVEVSWKGYAIKLLMFGSGTIGGVVLFSGLLSMPESRGANPKQWNNSVVISAVGGAALSPSLIYLGIKFGRFCRGVIEGRGPEGHVDHVYREL